MKTKLVVFDIAGTTVTDKGNVADAFMSAFSMEGIEVDLTEVKKVMGYRKKDAIVMLLQKFHPEKAREETLVAQIHSNFEEKMLEFYMSEKDLLPLPHAEDTFRWLHSQGIFVALNTGFTRLITEGILYRLGWKENPLIDEIICSDEVEQGRPAPFMINRIMENLGVSDPAEVMKVGDTEVDVLEGRNAHCGHVISVTTGAYTRNQLEHFNPDHIIESLSELPQYIH